MNMRPIPLTDKCLGGHNLMIRPHPAISRALILPEPASTDAGEITDKGDINHRAVLSRRANLVKHAVSPARGGAVVEHVDVLMTEWRARDQA